MSTLTTVTWNTFFRSFAGDASEVAEAERYALRLCKLADEVGSVEVEVQARSLLVIMARFSGRLHEMQCRASDLQRALSLVRGADSWLGWAAGYSAAVATGTRDASPPVPPDTSVDPVVGMARFVIETELTLSGRPGAALEILERPEHVHLGVMSDMTGLLQALALILDGRRDEAQPWIDRGERAAHRLQARNAAVVAAALRAELSRDPSGLAEVRSSDELGLADVLVLRARAVAGDEQAATRLPGAAEALGAPGLLARLN